MGKQKWEFPSCETVSGAVQHKVLKWSYSDCLVGWRQNQSLWCTPSKAVCKDGQWRSSVTSSTWLVSMPVFYSRSPLAAGEPGGKSCSNCQRSWGQNTWKGKGLWQLAQSGQQRKQPLQHLQARRQRQCWSERAANGTKHRTLEMPQARVW